MDASEKIFEHRLRRMAARQGLRLSKSRRRDERAIDFGKYFLFDARANFLVSSEYGMSLDNVEAWLTDPR